MYQLVRQLENGKLEVCEEGVAALSELKHEVKVVAVAGVYRSGKSFLLNQLLKGLRDVKDKDPWFEVGSSTASCTRGIWMMIHGDFVFLDSEGLSSMDQNANFDAKVFVLALLLSSMFIYNTSGVIDEAAIERLHLVAKLAEKISKANKIGFGLLWLVRDFSLALEDGFTDADDYLEKALGDRKNLTKARKQARIDIKRIFRNRQCKTMVRPALEERDLQVLKDMDPGKLRPEFIAQLEGVTKLVENAPIKKMSSQVVDGPFLGAFLSQVVEQLNTDAVPEVKAIFEYLAEQKLQEILNKSSEKYEERMHSLQVATWRDFMIAHEEARARSMKMLDGAFETPSKQEFVEKLEKRISQAWRAQYDRISLRSIKISKQEIKKRFEDAKEVKIFGKTGQTGPEEAEVLVEALEKDIIRGHFTHQLAQRDADVAKLSRELKESLVASETLQRKIDEILVAAGKQQDQFDEEMERKADECLAHEIELILMGMVSKVEIEALSKKVERITEEREALHERLRDFFLRASTLPEFYQDQVFVSEQGYLNLW